MPKISSSTSCGQALLDIVVTIGIFLILMHAVFSLVVVIYESMGYAQVHLIARHLATEKLEYLENLPYSQLGTSGGIPQGNIPEFETVERNGLNYTVHTSITYIDDAYDGTAPTDLLPTDYKQIRLEISWSGQYSSRAQPLVLVTTIAPKGLETAVSGGTLSVYVINAQANPVTQAQVHITNSAVTPAIDMTLQSNQDGRVILPGAPSCASCYHITITKTGYTRDKTYTTTEVANPNQRPITISNGCISEGVFVIDELSDLLIATVNDREANFAPLSNVSFRLTGSKQIGTNTDGDPVFKYDQELQTDGEGRLEIPNLEWDNYIITLLESSYTPSGITPSQPFAIDPAQSINLNMALSIKTPNSLLLNVKDPNGNSIASASANLSLTPDFIATSSSGLKDDPDFGQVFFGGLSATTYTYTLSHPDYQSMTGTIPVAGNASETIILPSK
ncbi:carboxypeptidase regulatory-like domain-containing protein [Candidatus Beckwithbacteria bacterium]|nr:carboxypeptidase regulatory-like domain-containing protein [Candidatus Beckwithbacteria bacterium]